MGIDRSAGNLFFVCSLASWFLAVGLATVRWELFAIGGVIAAAAFLWRRHRRFRRAFASALSVSAAAGLVSFFLTTSSTLGKDAGLVVLLLPIVAISFPLWRAIRNEESGMEGRAKS